MLLQIQSYLLPSLSPQPNIQFSITRRFSFVNPNLLAQHRPSRSSTLKCLIPFASEPKTQTESTCIKPSPSEVSRTIMELSSVGTLSAVTQDGWPLGLGVRFIVEPDGTPMLCLSMSNVQFNERTRSSLNVQLEQRCLWTPQCIILGSLNKLEDGVILSRIHSIWKRRFGEEVDKNLIYVVDVERVVLMEDFKKVCTWVSSSDYKSSKPDPLRDFAQKIVEEINVNNVEDVHHLCNAYVDLDFQVTEAKIIWVDRLGFDLRLCSPQKKIFEFRIPFTREVTNEKEARSSFNCMSQLAWEVGKGYHVPNFKKVQLLEPN